LVKKTPLSFGKKDQRFGKVHPSLGKKDQRFGIKVTPVFLKSTPLLMSLGKKDQYFAYESPPLCCLLLVKKTNALG
jgi:hypothetical protein